MKFAGLCELEFSALGGLPWGQRCLYLVLRWYMDQRTGLVGLVRGISYQSLSEELFVEPAPGRRESGRPSEKAVRCALAGLEKAGLIVKRGGDCLVFFLPKAVVSARSKSMGHQEGRGLGGGYQQGDLVDFKENSFVFDGEDGQGSGGLMGHTSEFRKNLISAEASAADGEVSGVVDKSALPLLPSAEQMARMVTAWEAGRGLSARVLASDRRVASWAERRVTSQELGDAYRLAVQSREKTKNRQPVNAGLIDSVLSDVLSRRVVSKGVEADSPKAWFASREGVLAMAGRVGVVRAEGESWEVFRFRVNDAVVEREKAGRKARAAR